MGQLSVLKISKGVVDKAELFPNLTGFSVSVAQSQSAFGTGLFGSGSPGFGTRPSVLLRRPNQAFVLVLLRRPNQAFVLVSHGPNPYLTGLESLLSVPRGPNQCLPLEAFEVLRSLMGPVCALFPVKFRDCI